MKINDQIFQIQKALFRAISSFIWAIKVLPENLALSRTTSSGFLAPSRNLMMEFQENTGKAGEWNDVSLYQHAKNHAVS